MDFGENYYNTTGERVKYVRKNIFQMTQEEFAEKLSGDGVNYAANYISMIERNSRHLSHKMAARIVKLHPEIRLEWLMCLDDFLTEHDRNRFISSTIYNESEYVERLIELHGYKISEYLQPEYVEDNGDKVREMSICISSPNGKSQRYLRPPAYTQFLKNVNDYLEGQLLLLFSGQYRRGVH